MSAASEKTYIVRFAILGHVKLTAASPELAKDKFDSWNVTAEAMIADGYDDIEVFEPEPLEEV